MATVCLIAQKDLARTQIIKNPHWMLRHALAPGRWQNYYVIKNTPQCERMDEHSVAHKGTLSLHEHLQCDGISCQNHRHTDEMHSNGCRASAAATSKNVYFASAHYQLWVRFGLVSNPQMDGRSNVADKVDLINLICIDSLGLCAKAWCLFVPRAMWPLINRKGNLLKK